MSPAYLKLFEKTALGSLEPAESAFQPAEGASTEFVILTKPDTENDDDKMIFLCTDMQYAFWNPSTGEPVQ